MRMKPVKDSMDTSTPVLPDMKEERNPPASTPAMKKRRQFHTSLKVSELSHEDFTLGHKILTRLPYPVDMPRGVLKK